MTVYRYIKDTIKNQQWELQITEDGNSFELWEQHSRTDKNRIIKEVRKQISKEEAETYKTKNKDFLIDYYTTL